MCRGWGNYLWSSCKKLRCNSKTYSWGIVASLSPPDRHAHYPVMEGSRLVTDSVPVLHFPLELAQWKSDSWQSQPRKTAAQKTAALPQVIWLCLLLRSISLSKLHPTTSASDGSEKQIEFKCANVTYDHNSWNTQILQFVKIASEKNINKLLSGVRNIFSNIKCKEYGNISVCII